MTAIDLHQHLWPDGFVAALRDRTSAPCIAGDELVTVEGRYAFDAAAHDPARRVAALDDDEIDVAVVSLQPSLGFEALPPAGASGARARLAGRDRRRRRVVAAGGCARSRRVASSRACPACRSARPLCSISTAARRCSTRSAQLGCVLFVHPEAAGPAPGRPEWWSWTTGYTAQMQAAYLAWLAGGRKRWPSLRIVFAILAGGAAIQLERLAQQGVEVRSSLEPERVPRRRDLRAARDRALHRDLRRRTARLRKRHARRRSARHTCRRPGLRRCCGQAYPDDTPGALLP